MKKTFTINISGIIFHIDEDAYDKLNNYLGILKSHFTKTVGKDEIISDIEGRIAELLQERLQEQKQVVSIEDIEEIIEILGQPSDFIEEEAEAQAAGEPEERVSKRLYRDPDNQIIGGVCSGIASYFNLDALWVRIIFLILLIGFISPIIYLVLWAVIPKATTTAEKLEMRGEKVNVTNIEKTIQEEIHNIKEKFNDLTGKTKGSFKKKERDTNTVAENIADFFLSLLKIVFRVIVIIAGIALLIMGLVFLSGFMISFFGWGGLVYVDNHDMITFPLPALIGLISNDIEAIGLMRVGLIMLIGIPIIMLIYGATKMIFRFEGIRQIGFIAFNIWLIGLIITLFFSFKIARNFKHDATIRKQVEFYQPSVDTLWISSNQQLYDDVYEEYGNSTYFAGPNLVITEEGEIFSYARLRIRKSADQEFHLHKHVYSRGRTEIDAENNTDHITHNIYQSDSSLVIDPYYQVVTGQSWRNQEVMLELQVPVGKAVQLDWNTRKLLRFQGNYSSYYLPGKTWIMTEDGLKEESELPRPSGEATTGKLKKNANRKNTLTFIMLQNIIAI